MPLRVLHVIPSIGPLRGGPSFVLRTMAKGLAARGVDVHVATTDDNGPFRLDVPFNIPIRKDGVTYWYFPRQTSFYIFSYPMARWLAEHIPAYDLVHIHALFSFPVAPAAYWAARHDVPYIVRPLGTLNRWGVSNRRRWPKKLSLHLIERRILAKASAVHFTSEQESVEAREAANIGRFFVIPNPVDLKCGERELLPGQLQSQYPQLQGRRVVLFLSRLDQKKGLDLLLPAFASLRRQVNDVALVLGGAGETAFVAGLRQMTRTLGIEQDVIWTGFIDGDRKLGALAGSTVFVLPSYSENFGIAVVEAMACGLPVVVSDQVAVHREIAAAGAGVVVPCKPQDLGGAILRLLSQPEVCKQMARSGIDLAGRFSTAVVTERLLQAYHALIDLPVPVPACAGLG